MQTEEKWVFLVRAKRTESLETENPSFLTKLNLYIIDLLINMVCRQTFLDFGHKVKSSQLVENFNFLVVAFRGVP